MCSPALLRHSFSLAQGCFAVPHGISLCGCCLALTCVSPAACELGAKSEPAKLLKGLTETSQGWRPFFFLPLIIAALTSLCAYDMHAALSLLNLNSRFTPQNKPISVCTVPFCTLHRQLHLFVFMLHYLL